MAFLRFAEVRNQADALRLMAEVAASSLRDPKTSPLIIRTARAIVSDCAARDDQCEVEAIYEAVKHGTDRVKGMERGVRYVSDPRTFDHFATPAAILRECEAGACAEDCLPYETKVLRRDYRLVELESIRSGDVIMGDGEWTTVTNVWDKGEQEILAISLANGSTLRATEEHRVFRVPKTRQGCAGPRDAAEEVRVHELRPGDDLLTIERIPFGAEAIEPDLAWLLGVYIADGYAGYSESDAATAIRAFVSGKDGHPKEEQKRRVVQIAKRRGWPTRWHERYVAINDAKIAAWLAATGRRAPQKHVPSGLNYDEQTIRALLDGLLADACVRDRETTHGTTSELLAVQLRILYRMIGQSTFIRRVDHHGGLGANPIYRVIPRMSDRGRGAKPHARIRSISEGGITPVMDIETDSGRFYLPETDLVVHNCDGHTILVVALLSALGFKAGLRAWGPRVGVKRYEHVYPVVALPKHGPWPRNYGGHGLDTTVEEAYVGWEPRRGAVITDWIEEG